jgi:hypothetical protein
VLATRLIHVLADITSIPISYLVNAASPGAAPTRAEFSVPRDLAFEDVFSRLCAKMNVPPETAVLGYKFDKEPVRAPPHRLMNQGDYSGALEVLTAKISRAYATKPKLNVYWLVSGVGCTFDGELTLLQNNGYESSVRKPGRPKTSIASSSAGAVPADQLEAVAPHLRALKEHTQSRCGKDGHTWCRPDPLNPRECVKLDLQDLTYWAGKMVGVILAVRLAL